MPRRPRARAARRAAPDRLFVDSGAWIALVSARDRRHAEAEAMFREAAGQPLDRFEASPLTLIEFATAEHHRAARAWLDRLADPPVSYTDAVSFAVMQATRCTAAMSFGRDFRRAGFALWRGGRR